MPRSTIQDPSRCIDHHVGERLQRRRRSLGLTARDLEERGGFTRGSIARIEAGTRVAGASHLFRLAVLLDIDVTYFFEDLAHEGVVADSNCKLPTHDETEEFIQTFAALKQPKLRQSLMDMVKAMGRGRRNRTSGAADES